MRPITMTRDATLALGATTLALGAATLATGAAMPATTGDLRPTGASADQPTAMPSDRGGKSRPISSTS